MSLDAIILPWKSKYYSCFVIGHFYFGKIGHYHIGLTVETSVVFNQNKVTENFSIIMERILFSIRYVSWIAILCSITGSLLMFLIGALKTYKAIAIFLFGEIPHESLSSLKPVDVTTAYLIKSLDAFLIALVLLIFSYGVYSLFISKHSDIDKSGALKWIRIPSIAHLKNILAEVIIVILFVKFLEVALLNLDNLSWKLLVLPGSILLLALSLKFLGLRGKPSSKD